MGKSWLSCFLVVLLAVSLAAALPTGDAQTGKDVSGVISYDQTWTTEGSPYTLTGNLLIDENANLKIDPGVTVNIGVYSMHIAGGLDARGTPNNRIIINVGVGVQAGLAFDLSNQDSVLQYAFINSTRTYTYPTIETYSSPKIDHNLISAPDGDYAISCHGDGTPEISNNQIIGSVSVHSFGCSQVYGNTIRNPGGNALGVGGSAKVFDNTMRDSNVGVVCSDWFGTPSLALVASLERNLIVDNTIGLSIGRGYPSDGYQCQLTVQHNTITGNIAGVVMDSDGTSDSHNFPTIKNNNIYSNSIYNVHTYTAVEMDLSSNWWGTTDTQAISQKNVAESEFGTLKVLTDPILTAPDPEAPVYTPASSTPTPESTLQPTDSPAPTATPIGVDANPQNISSSGATSNHSGEPDYTTMAYGLGMGVALAVGVIVAVVLVQRVRTKSFM